MSVKLTVKFLNESLRDTTLFLFSVENIRDAIEQYKESHSYKNGTDFYIIANVGNSENSNNLMLFNQDGRQITEKELKVIKLEYFMQLNN